MKGIAGFSLFLFIFWQASALEVDRTELKTDASVRIEFQNFEGTPEKVETVDQIRGHRQRSRKGRGSRRRKIPGNPRGRSEDRDRPRRGPFHPREGGCGRPHQETSAYILAGYLSSAFGYADRDALVLAEFVTVYNAVYRNNLDYFKTRFKPLVLANLSREKAGLSPFPIRNGRARLRCSFRSRT